METSRLHPQLRARYRLLPNPPVRSALFLLLMRRGVALLPAPRLRDGVRHERVTLAPGGGVHIYTPASGGNGGALLWIHGGGLVIGSASQDHPHSVSVAADLDIVVVSAEYRLAPEHPFPAPLDDCLDAWRWLQQSAPRLGVDPARIAVGGQSAGGGLAASLVQRIHDGGDTQPVAQWLFCPMLDDRTAANPDLDRLNHFLWHNRSNRAGWGAYLGTAPGADAVPEYAVPARRTDLRGLPPAWIGVGDIELFYEEACGYADALRRAGVETTLDTVPGGPHAFESVAANAAVSMDYRHRARAWLRSHLDR